MSTGTDKLIQYQQPALAWLYRNRIARLELRGRLKTFDCRSDQGGVW